MRPSEALQACAGWIQGSTFRDSDGNEIFSNKFLPPLDKLCMCLYGAMQYSRMNGGITQDQEDGMDKVLTNDILHHGPAWWNDRPGRTKGDVIWALQEAEKMVLDAAK